MHSNEYFSTRRTIRQYDQNRPVDPTLLTGMLKAAAQAPNTGNMQIYSAIVTTDPAIKRELAPAHFNQPAATGAAAIVTFCLDLNRFNRWCRLNNADPGLDNLQGFTWGVIDTSIFTQQFCTIAELHGLGTCYLGTTTYNAETIAKVLELPMGVIPVITLAVGYPAVPGEMSERLPVEATVHAERYHTPTDDEIREYYAEKESLPASKSFVEENGKENLAQVFTDIRYPREANEKFSHVYRAFLKNQGVEI